MFEKVSILLDCPTASLEEFVPVDEYCNVCTAAIIADKKHFGVWSKLKKYIDADSDDDDVMQNAAPVFPDKSRFSIPNDSQCKFSWREVGKWFHPSNITEETATLVLELSSGEALCCTGGLSSTLSTDAL
ncbi:hypothetical protein TNCV_3141131 [Trichonephila clavipes]|nr:hypothetical protein TNCV_3141131 [Trichonephila clavipes]